VFSAITIVTGVIALLKFKSIHDDICALQCASVSFGRAYKSTLEGLTWLGSIFSRDSSTQKILFTPDPISIDGEYTIALSKPVMLKSSIGRRAGHIYIELSQHIPFRREHDNLEAWRRSHEQWTKIYQGKTQVILYTIDGKAIESRGKVIQGRPSIYLREANFTYNKHEGTSKNGYILLPPDTRVRYGETHSLVFEFELPSTATGLCI